MARSALLSRRSAVREYLVGAVWVLPTLGIVVGLAAGAALSGAGVAPGSVMSRVVFQGSADDARQILTVVSATMITTTGLVFSLTVLSLQIASSQFSVRLLRTFLRDMPNQVVLAIFVCTFAYATGGLHNVGERVDGAVFVPQVAVTGALVLVFASTIALVFFLHHLMHSIQIDTIIEKVQQRTLALVDEMFPEPDTPGVDPTDPPTPPAAATPVLAHRSGYIQTIDVDAIGDDAAGHGLAVQFVTSVGDYVTAGGILGWCWHRGEPATGVKPGAVQHVLKHVHIGFERTLQQDPRFGLRQMVDIGLRALSAAINDPYTAIQVVHHLSAVESVLASRALPDEVRRDSSGSILVWLPYPGFATYLHVGCSQIRRYGAREPLVFAALLQMLSAVAANCVNDSRRGAVQSQIDLVVRAAKDIPEASDRALVTGAAARATEVVQNPGMLAPPASAFGMVASAAAACSDGSDGTVRRDGSTNAEAVGPNAAEC